MAVQTAKGRDEEAVIFTTFYFGCMLLSVLKKIVIVFLKM